MSSSPGTAPPVSYERMTLPARRRVPVTACFNWIGKGWTDLMAVGDIGLAYGALFAAIGAFITYFSLGTPQLTLNFWSGFLLIGPLLAIGLYRVAQLREQGHNIRLSRCVQVLGEHKGEVALFILFLGLIMIAWILFSGLMVAVFFGDIPPGFEAFTNALGTADGLKFLAVLFLSGAIFAFVVFASCAFSLPMLIDGRADLITAVVTSIRAVIEQPAAMLMWAAVITALTVVGMATLFFGFTVIFPILGFATWHSYRDVFGSDTPD